MGSCLSADGQRGGSSPSSPASGTRRQRGRLRRLTRTSLEEDDELCRIPGRKFRNGSTNTASLFTQQGKKGTNQDAMIVWENFGDRSDTVFCGVFDGHGPNGHTVARKNHTDTMNSNVIPSPIPMDESIASTGFDEKDRRSKFSKTMKDSFLKAFRIVDKELRLHPEIDCFYSGTTAVTLVKQAQDLVIGNVGDSRAVLGTRDENNSLIAVQLTLDLKPSLPREAERIRRCRGRIFALRDEPEVVRVWLPNIDSPGLAMARAFGDFCLKDFGLISVPEVSYRRITEKDEFIVLASDGVWDVLSNKEAIHIVASAPTRASAARYLIESAVQAWKSKYPTSKIDDCAAVCLFLNTDTSNNSTLRGSEADGTLHEVEVVGHKQVYHRAETTDKCGNHQASSLMTLHSWMKSSPTLLECPGLSLSLSFVLK
ncbi:probable protein phosphatase 2C 33 isoform X2 [Zingiber officinale]|uniref:probable protein phosphatase 2C 33 isoform X2 n=1 Tax=Zingiber officinale TaxID=94328 RepID=UPI001C4C188A|nr:probable protein phosphatase 2C 33 isoform X2 [Zingiber officinale]